MLLQITSELRAELRSQFGVGSASAALTGSDRAKAYDGLTVLNNPALMSEQLDGKLTLGFMGVFDQFESTPNIVVNNTNLGAATRETGTVPTDVPDVYLLALGAVLPIGKSENQYRLGLSLVTPVTKLAAPASQDYYTPQYALYNADSQRLVLGLGFSFKPHDLISVGFGGQLFTTMGTTVNTRFPQRPATSRINQATEVQPAFAPQVGVVFRPALHHRLSLHWIMERDYRVDFESRNSIYLINGSAPFNFRGSQSLFYDPEVWTAAYCLEVGRFDIHTAIEYERWSHFDGQVVQVGFDTLGNLFAQDRPDTRYRDILVPRLGLQWRIAPRHAARTGYAYRPSPVPDLSGETNFLDTDRHILGAGHTWKTPWSIGGQDLRLDWHLQVHYLNPRQVNKRNSSSVGAPAVPGGPPMTVAGWVWNYGFTLSVDL